MNPSAHERVAIVVGGGTGQGRAIAIDLGADHRIMVAGRRPDPLRETAEQVGAHATAVPTDATSPSQVAHLMRTTMQLHGRIDVLVNAQGILSPPLPMEDGDLDRALEVWNHVYANNTTSHFLTCFAVMPHLTRPGGRIINLASMAAMNGSPLRADKGIAYSASKSALHGLTASFAQLLAPEGITVNAIVVGFVMNTGMSTAAAARNPEMVEKMVATIPVGRAGEPQDIAAAARFLAAPQSGFITGELLNVNGGSVFGR